MSWEKPRYTEIKMDSEVSAYQDDTLPSEPIDEAAALPVDPA